MGETVEDLIKDFLVRPDYFRDVKMLDMAVHFKISHQTMFRYMSENSLKANFKYRNNYFQLKSESHVLESLCNLYLYVNNKLE